MRAYNKYLIFDKSMPAARCRFTIAHELGHIFLGHIPANGPTAINREPGPTDDPHEQAGNVLAARVLALRVCSMRQGWKRQNKLQKLATYP